MLKFSYLCLLLLVLVLASCSEQPTERVKAKSLENLYFIVQREDPAAFIFNQSRKILKSWTSESAFKNKKNNRGWHNAKMTSDGGLIAINKGRSIFKLDFNNKKVWSAEGWYHHDLIIDQRGHTLAFNRKIDEVEVPKVNKKIYILNEFIADLDENGNVVDELKIFSIVSDLIPSKFFQEILDQPEGKPRPDSKRDIFHANSIDLYYPKNEQSKKLDCSPGSYLISLKNISLVIVIDQQTKEVCWNSQGVNLELQHDASFTKDNDILIFNNRNKKQSSEVILVDPQSKKIIRTETGSKNHKFYTSSGGSAQLLKDGSLLVGVTESGKIINFNKSGAINFQIDNNLREKEVQKFFRIRKIEDLNQYPFIKNL